MRFPYRRVLHGLGWLLAVLCNQAAAVDWCNVAFGTFDDVSTVRQEVPSAIHTETLRHPQFPGKLVRVLVVDGDNVQRTISVIVGTNVETMNRPTEGMGVVSVFCIGFACFTGYVAATAPPGSAGGFFAAMATLLSGGLGLPLGAARLFGPRTQLSNQTWWREYLARSNSPDVVVVTNSADETLRELRRAGFVPSRE